MTLELWMLLWSAVLMLAMPLIYGPAFIKALGAPTMLGDRSNLPAVEGWFTRAKRAHVNLGENLLPFAAVVLVAHAAGIHDSWTRGGAVLFLVARLAHLGAYVVGAGVPRTLAYVAGLAGILAITGVVVLAG